MPADRPVTNICKSVVIWFAMKMPDTAVSPRRATITLSARPTRNVRIFCAAIGSDSSARFV